MMTIFGAGTFVVGSLLMLGDEESNIKGDILYVIGSVIYFLQSLYLLFEMFHSHTRSYLLAKNRLLLELFENLMYVLACIVFLVGTAFFWPGLFKGDEAILYESYGSKLFIVGSFMFVWAGSFNSLTFSKETVMEELLDGLDKNDQRLKNAAKRSYQLHALALFCSITGGCMFVTGSYLFRPEYSKKCDQGYLLGMNTTGHMRTSQKMCLETAVAGTWLFFWGSVLYTVQAFAILFNTCLKGAVFDVSIKKRLSHEESGSGSEAEE
jgi:hypothetical protein